MKMNLRTSGSESPGDGEEPARRFRVRPFWLSPNAGRIQLQSVQRPNQASGKCHLLASFRRKLSASCVSAVFRCIDKGRLVSMHLSNEFGRRNEVSIVGSVVYYYRITVRWQG